MSHHDKIKFQLCQFFDTSIYKSVIESISLSFLYRERELCELGLKGMICRRKLSVS